MTAPHSAPSGICLRNFCAWFSSIMSLTTIQVSDITTHSENIEKETKLCEWIQKVHAQVGEVDCSAMTGHFWEVVPQCGPVSSCSCTLFLWCQFDLQINVNLEQGPVKMELCSKTFCLSRVRWTTRRWNLFGHLKLHTLFIVAQTDALLTVSNCESVSDDATASRFSPGWPGCLLVLVLAHIWRWALPLGQGFSSDAGSPTQCDEKGKFFVLLWLIHWKSENNLRKQNRS